MNRNLGGSAVIPSFFGEVRGIMKKILLGTTALAAAGLVAPAALAEEGLTVGINGYYTAEVAIVDSNDQQVFGVEEDDVQVKHEGEISINGAVTLDNGITAGVEVNIEATNAAGGTIDEAYAYLEGSFGRIQVGEEASAAFLMHYSAPYFVGSHGVDSPNFSNTNRVSAAMVGTATAPYVTARTATYITLTGDTNKVTYFTPRFSGFQLGVSYTPESLTADVGGQGSVGGSRAFGLLGNTGFVSDTIEVGANYTGKVGEAEVGVSAGYARSDSDVVGLSDPEAWSFGANVVLGAFTLGGAYYMSDDMKVDVGALTTTEEDAYSVGLQYVTGPWTVGAGYFRSEIDTTGMDIDYTNYEVGGTYALGKGVSVYGVVDIYRDEYGATDLDTEAVAFGIDLAF